MAIEKKLAAVAPRLLTVNGNTTGTVNLSNTSGFKVKQLVVIKSSTQSELQLQVKRVNKTSLIVGPIPTKPGQAMMTVRQDLSAYLVADGAYIYAEEQDKANLKAEDIIQAVYRQEPGTTIGVELDDEFGEPFSPSNPIPVASAPMWDEIDLTYNAQQDLDTATFTKNGNSTTLTLTYDAFGNLTKVTRT